jgi:uncharacterized sulfatase
MNTKERAKRVVVIMTDTQTTDMVGCYGNSDMKTPHLDGLAADGVRFDRAYCCQPVCTPARSAIFTGTFPHSNGAWSNCMPLGDNVQNLGRRLSDQGMHTAFVGKWHLDGGDYFGTGTCPDGWDPDYWYDMRNYLEELSPEDRKRSRDPRTNAAHNLTEDFTFGHRVSNRAIDFLSKCGEEEFMLVVSYDEPHHPFLCPEPFASMYDDYELPKRPNVWDTLDDKPDHQRVWAGPSVKEDKDALHIKHSAFFACNSYVDYEIGRVVSAIDQYVPDALVVYLSDHGDPLHSHSLEGKGPAMYEEIVRTPLIVRWPGVLPKGSVSSTVVSHVDIAPTLFEAAGKPMPKLFEGESFLGAALDPASTQDRSAFMEFGRFEVDHDGFGGFQPIRAVRDSRYKLVVNLMTQDEFYDVEEDPYEMTNLIDEESRKNQRDRLHDALLDWMNRTRDPFRGYYWERRPWRKDARKATWDYTAMTRQRENEEYEPRQLDYDTGLEMAEAVRPKHTRMYWNE